MDPDYGEIIVIVQKHTSFVTNMYYDLPYYVSIIKRRRNTYAKLRWLNLNFLDHEVIVGLGNPNSIPAFAAGLKRKFMQSFENPFIIFTKCSILDV